MRKRIGEFLVEKGVLTPAQVDEILEYGGRTGLRFGEAGLELGLLTQRKLIEVFGQNYKVDFFHLDAQYFPEVTRELLPVDVMLKAGALPLGFKTDHKFFRKQKLLNVGFLDPARLDSVDLVEREARKALGSGAFHSIKPFLVLSDQFLEVMWRVYQLSDVRLRERDAEQLDPTLGMFVAAGLGGARQKTG